MSPQLPYDVIGQEPRGRFVYEEPGSVVVNITVTVGGPDNGVKYGIPFGLEADYDFELLAIAIKHDQNFAINWKWPNGRYFSNDMIEDANVAGTASFPVPMPKSYMLRGGAQLKFDVKNLGAGTLNMQIHLIGMKRYATRG